ncbi:MAG: hypothetical protein DSM106950_13955 [Stigonema ocellatum SAG 48.90 = DSM 106950]|nr:hypothetical protein [Stigonema ocellatum SAG 48.90 = DSM 106950]
MGSRHCVAQELLLGGFPSGRTSRTRSGSKRLLILQAISQIDTLSGIAQRRILNVVTPQSKDMH